MYHWRSSGECLAEAPMDRSAPKEPTHHRPCVLVADDSPEVRSLLAEILRDEGISVVEAADGPAALAMLSAEPDAGPVGPVDLLVTDNHMPGLSGLELTRELRRQGAAVSILLVAGAADEDLLQDAVGCGVDAVISKPFALRTLLDVIGGLLRP
jgi:CheY-like chemotaxis protein